MYREELFHLLTDQCNIQFLQEEVHQVDLDIPRVHHTRVRPQVDQVVPPDLHTEVHHQVEDQAIPQVHHQVEDQAVPPDHRLVLHLAAEGSIVQ